LQLFAFTPTSPGSFFFSSRLLLPPPAQGVAGCPVACCPRLGRPLHAPRARPTAGSNLLDTRAGPPPGTPSNPPPQPPRTRPPRPQHAPSPPITHLGHAACPAGPGATCTAANTPPPITRAWAVPARMPMPPTLTPKLCHAPTAGPRPAARRVALAGSAAAAAAAARSPTAPGAPGCLCLKQQALWCPASIPACLMHACMALP
jgi:hypothetical protein